MSKTTKALAIMGVVAGLGVAALPMSSYAATDSTNMGVKTTIEDYIAIETTTDGSDDTDAKNVIVAGVVNNGDVKTGTGTFNVKTNNKQGYYVQISATDTDLTNTTSGQSEKIPAGNPAKGTSAWGYRASADGVSNVTIKDDVYGSNDYAAVDGTATTIATGAGATADAGDNITMTFGISASASQAAGTYKGVVTLTATSGTEAGA